MGITRRQALGVFAGAGAAAAATVTRAEASTSGPTPPADALGLLYDATRCIGCKACMVACAESNALVPDTSRYPAFGWAELGSRPMPLIEADEDGEGPRTPSMSAASTKKEMTALSNATSFAGRFAARTRFAFLVKCRG